MGKVFLQGLMLFVAGVVCLILNTLLNLGLGSLVFGVAIGGILGLVGDGGPVGKALGFLVGMIVALVTFVVRALFLNDSFAGNVVLLVLALGLITVICALTVGRLPLWTALAGAALVIGAYETPFVNAPQNILSEMLQYTTMAFVPAAFAFLATIFVTDRIVPAGSSGAAASPPGSAPPVPAGATASPGATGTTAPPPAPGTTSEV